VNESSRASAPSGAPSDRIVLRVPADPAYLAVLRTATAGLAARLDLTLDEIEDLRIAVDEACALLLPGTGQGDELTAVFDLHPDALDVEITGPTQPLPEPASFAWAVLEALVGKVDTHSDSDGSWIRLRHERAVSADGPEQTALG
jgi:serine/threonine-protein kinase RsbW